MVFPVMPSSQVSQSSRLSFHRPLRSIFGGTQIPASESKNGREVIMGLLPSTLQCQSKHSLEALPREEEGHQAAHVSLGDSVFEQGEVVLVSAYFLIFRCVLCMFMLHTHTRIYTICTQCPWRPEGTLKSQGTVLDGCKPLQVNQPWSSARTKMFLITKSHLSRPEVYIFKKTVKLQTRSTFYHM